jgi:hypothetical protein
MILKLKMKDSHEIVLTDKSQYNSMNKFGIFFLRANNDQGDQL